MQQADCSMQGRNRQIQEFQHRMLIRFILPNMLDNLQLVYCNRVVCIQMHLGFQHKNHLLRFLVCKRYNLQYQRYNMVFRILLCLVYRHSNLRLSFLFNMISIKLYCLCSKGVGIRLQIFLPHSNLAASFLISKLSKMQFSIHNKLQYYLLAHRYQSQESLLARDSLRSKLKLF